MRNIFRVNDLIVSLKDVEVAFVEYSDYSNVYKLYIYMRNRRDGFSVDFKTMNEAIKVFNELIDELNKL